MFFERFAEQVYVLLSVLNDDVFFRRVLRGSFSQTPLWAMVSKGRRTADGRTDGRRMKSFRALAPWQERLRINTIIRNLFSELMADLVALH